MTDEREMSSPQEPGIKTPIPDTKKRAPAEAARPRGSPMTRPGA
jgi:hypothetical protein